MYHNIEVKILLLYYTCNIVIELFNKGNFLLLDENNIIRIAKKYQKFKERAVLAKKEYSFPKSHGINFLTINKEELRDLFKNSDVEIVRNLSRNIHISGLYSEEIWIFLERSLTISTSEFLTINKEELRDLFKNS